MFCSFVVLFLCLVHPVYHCDQLAGEEEAGCFAFLWFCDFFTVCRGLFALLLGVIGKLCSATVAYTGHFLHYSF